LIIIGSLIFLPTLAKAHRSGCHRWHSCPSDRGTYVCGDLSHCAQCPDNAYCSGGHPLTQAAEPLPSAPPVEQTRRATSQEIGGLRLDYQGFTLWLNCQRRGAVRFRYNAQRDQGKLERQAHFALDPDVPSDCQQTAVTAYSHPQQRYDRGHLVPANHLDHSEAALKQSNYMTNILPQAANMNRGAWYRTEKIIECYRDIDELLVLGGVIWGSTPEDDYFTASHGVATPDAFWKLIIRGEDRVMAWIIPNTPEATYSKLDQYLVSVRTLEARVSETFAEVPAYVKDETPEVSWLIPIGCESG
jgi:endonuclease G, mitochondrial